jgi:hypothetical protein
MPAVALSRVVESGSGGQDLVAGTWQRLEALPDPRSPQGRICPLACLVAIAICAFTAAGNDRFAAVGQWIRRAGTSRYCTPRSGALAAVPADISARETGHGRAETRTLKAAHVNHLDFPGARQAIKITCRREDAARGKTTRQTV